MGIAIWCDVKDNGHAFDERKAMLVNPGRDALYFCKTHCIPAVPSWAHALRTARN